MTKVKGGGPIANSFFSKTTFFRKYLRYGSRLNGFQNLGLHTTLLLASLLCPMSHEWGLAPCSLDYRPARCYQSRSYQTSPFFFQKKITFRDSTFFCVVDGFFCMWSNTFVRGQWNFAWVIDNVCTYTSAVDHIKKIKLPAHLTVDHIKNSNHANTQSVGHPQNKKVGENDSLFKQLSNNNHSSTTHTRAAHNMPKRRKQREKVGVGAGFALELVTPVAFK